jgi:hypothetical protein
VKQSPSWRRKTKCNYIKGRSGWPVLKVAAALPALWLTLDLVGHPELQQQRGVDPQRGAAQRSQHNARQQQPYVGRRRHEHVAHRQAADRQRARAQQVWLPARDTTQKQSSSGSSVSCACMLCIVLVHMSARHPGSGVCFTRPHLMVSCTEQELLRRDRWHAAAVPLGMPAKSLWQAPGTACCPPRDLMRRHMQVPAHSDHQRNQQL